ncbi:MAG: DUF1801 domain-containing protein [bacterium]
MKINEDFIITIAPELAQMRKLLREIIQNCAKELKEEIKWDLTTNFINKHTCSIHVHKEHINLQFFFGAKLKSSDLLVGTGKTMRHLKISNPKDVVSSKIKQLMNEAIEFDKKLGFK